MVTTNQFITRFCIFACFSVAAVSCSEDEFFDKENETSEEKVANTFDFSTTQNIDLIVDYSDFETYGPVLFSIYSSNPIVNENTLNEYVDESIEPIFEAYTDDKGKFDATITLPAYAKVLHVVTGNVFIGLRRAPVEVINGEAKVKVEGNKNWASRATRATLFTGEQTNNLEHPNSNLFNLWNAVDKNYKPGNIYYSGGNPYAQSGTVTQVCKKWHTPLGTWDTASGRPNYLMKSSSTPGLIISNEVINGMFGTIQNALKSGSTCNEKYRAAADLMLIKDSEVSLTALGSYTWWNSSLGYYYYTGKKPTKIKDIDIIMLFPNTQDGQRDKSWDYQGNIGMQRGDAIQLMYYPNISKNGDLSGATKIFPKGTCIGFVLKSNAWGMIDKDHSIEYVSRQSNGIRRYNVWQTSTEGLTFAAVNSWHEVDFSKKNPNGESRTAKFAYKDKKGNSYTIVSFEDACNDKDYDDVIFAVNPANVFAEQAQVEQGKSTSHGVYAFEDMWPEPGDYDMNDVMVALEHEMTFSNEKVTKQVFSLTTYQNYVSRKSGLAMKLVTKTTPSSVVMKKKAPGASTASKVEFTQDGAYYYLTEDITGELGTTYIFEVTYSSAVSLSNVATVQPFLYRKEDNGKQWEVHIPGEAPTNKMNKSYFGKGDDCSNPSAKKYFVRHGDYPFAFYMDNARIDYFTDNILKRANESKPIDTFFPEFIGWSKSNGKNYQDWYLHPRK